MSKKTVFISYRRDTAGNLFARLVEGALTRRGYDVFLDVDCIDAGEWAKQILTEVPKRAHFLLLLTPGALGRCTDENDWLRREFLMARERGRNIVPVREESVDPVAMRAAAPEAVKAIFDLQIHTIRHGIFESDVETLTTRYIPPHKAPKEGISKSTSFQADISRIIKYAPAELIGREAETKLLADAWDQAVRGEPKRPRVLTFVALGGEGKTSLIAKWAAELAHQGWPGCEAAFAWSFYHQGTDEKSADSSDVFFKEALTFFGDPAMGGSAQGAFDKGRRLAGLVGERRALLVLDGLEPLQYAPTSPTPGELKDQGLAALLKGLAATCLGLCVVTTRYALPDLRAYWQTTAPMHELPRLSTAAGVKLLRTIGVRTGSQADFEKLVEDVDGHALTLQILGQFLVRAFHRDIRRRDRIDLEKADAKIQGGHAFRAMEAYVKWLEDDSEEARREVAVLKLLSLFDRPATADCVAALRKAPAIPGLTEPLVGLAEDDWEFSLSALRDAKLLTVNQEEGSGVLLALDAHPLLREYFARQLRQQQPEAWRAAHRRISVQPRRTSPSPPSKTSNRSTKPWPTAVRRGCSRRRATMFTATASREGIRKLGAFGSDLGAVACFFETPWSRVSPALTEDIQALLLSAAGFRTARLGPADRGPRADACCDRLGRE